MLNSDDFAQQNPIANRKTIRRFFQFDLIAEETEMQSSQKEIL